MSDFRPTVSLTMCCFFAGIVIVATKWSFASSLAPIVVGSTGLTLSVLQLISDIREAGRNRSKVPDKAWSLMSWLCIFVVTALAIGLLWGGFVGIAAFLKIRERTGVIVAIGVAATYTTIIWLLFSVALGLDLFPGFFFT